MTPKQTERTKKKIVDIKRSLAAEKRKFGCYDDSRGLRYLPTKYFMQLGDYAGGLKYLNWFDKNFPDDSGFPDFLFEKTIILFKCNKLKEAAQMAFQTFCSNPYWIDKFFSRPVTLLDMLHSSNLARPEYTETLTYSYSQPELADFSAWLDILISTEDFINRSNKYVDIFNSLSTETDKELRHYLVRQAYLLKQGQ